MRRLLATLALATLPPGASGCERSPGCLDDCPVAQPASPDRGPVTVTVDTSQKLGSVVTGGGTNFTGFASYVPATNNRIDRLAQMPYRLNRIHFSGEVPDTTTWRTEDRLDSHLPQSMPPPAAWDFQWLDPVVAVAKSVRDGGGPDFIFTIHNAPQWMTINQQIQGYPPRNIADYATYCARLVAYYNQGSFVDDQGRTVQNPAGAIGVHYWEIWNEPDINDVGEQDNAVMTAAEYATIFVQVTAAMRKVDPTIKIGGPNTISDIDDTPTYIAALLGTGAQVDFIAIHQYQADATMTDQVAFQVASKMKNYPTDTNLPLVISESNSDSQDTQSRTGSAFEWAAMPLEYLRHIERGTWRVLRWETYEHNYDLIDALAGEVTTTYWAERTFWAAIPEGGTRVSCISSSADVECLAVLVPMTNKLDVALINIGVADPNDSNGVGVRHTIDVQVADGMTRTFAVQPVDRDTPVSTGPIPAKGAPTAGHGVPIDGYGIATLLEQ